MDIKTDRYAINELPPMPEEPKKKGKWRLPVLVAGVLLLGIGIGGAVQPTPDPIIKTETKTNTVTETKEVPVTPNSCKEALGFASDGFAIAAKWPPLVAKAYGAGITMDQGKAAAIIAQMKELNVRLGALLPKYKSASSQCLAG